MASISVPNPYSARRRPVAPLVRRLFSLSGVAALGSFLVFHLAINSTALQSDAAFDRAVSFLHRTPGLAWAEVLLVFVPLAFHAAIGLWLVVANAPLSGRSPYPPAVRAAVRASGVGALAFLAMHLAELRLREPGARMGGAELATVLAADLSSTLHGFPLRGSAYLVGTACVTFHFAAGLWAWFARTRAGARPRSRRWVAWSVAAVGAAMWAQLANVVVFHATGARLFGSPTEDADPSRLPCPEGD